VTIEDETTTWNRSTGQCTLVDGSAGSQKKSAHTW